MAFEELAGGYCADVVESDGEVVRKKLGEHDAHAFSPLRFVVASNGYEGGLEAGDRAERYLELDALEEVQGFRPPEVYSVKRDEVRMEHVYGSDIIADMEENPDVAREFGSKLREAHASSVAFRDFNTGNFVDEQGALVPVDAEVFTPEANLIDLQFELAAAFYSFEQVHSYDDEIIDSFSDGYGLSWYEKGVHRSFADIWTDLRDC